MAVLPPDGALPADALPPAKPPRASSSPTSMIRYGRAGDDFLISIESVPEPAQEVTLDREASSLYLTFRHAAPALDAPELLHRGSEWLSSVNTGYDAILLILRAGVVAQVDLSAGILTLRLHRSASGAPTTASGARGGGAYRLDLLRARLLLQAQELDAARRAYAALHAEAPAEPEPLAGLASVEMAAGRWRRALELYRQAAALAADKSVLVDAMDAIEREQTGSARLDVARRLTYGGALTAAVRADAIDAAVAARAEESWRWSIAAETVAVQTDAVRRASDGTIAAFKGTRERGDLDLQFDALNGSVGVASVYAGGTRAGLGGLWRQLDDRGAWRTELDWQRPNWDYVEGIVGNAWRDRLGFGRSERLQAAWSARLDLFYNRYGLPDTSDAARSTTATGELRYTGLAGIAGLAATYGFDAEYLSHLATRRTASGDAYAPLPVLDREVHSASLGYVGSVGGVGGGVISVNGYAGAGLDRFGHGGPIAALTLAWTCGPLSASAHASNVHNVARSRGSSEEVGVGAMLHL